MRLMLIDKEAASTHISQDRGMFVVTIIFMFLYVFRHHC